MQQELMMLDDKVKTTLYVVGLFHEAKQMEWISGGPDITAKGLSAFYELIDSGFIPDPNVYWQVVKNLSDDKSSEAVKIILQLLGEVRQRLNEWPDTLEVK